MAGDLFDEEWDLPDDQWQVLEHHAILSTQQQQQQHAQNGGNVRQNLASDPSETRTSSTEQLGSSSLRKVVLNPHRPPLQPHALSEHNSFDNPQLDEDGVPLVVEEQPRAYIPHKRTDETTQREQWRVNRFAQKQGPQLQQRQQGPVAPRQAYREYQKKQETARNDPPVTSQLPQADMSISLAGNPLTLSQSTQGFQLVQKPASDVDLRRELEALHKERALLSSNLKQAQSDLYTARGEIAVIRTKATNEVKLAERQLSVTRKQMQEEATKHSTALQSRDAAYQKLVTDSSFLKHELKEQTRQVKSLQQQAKEREKAHQRSNVINLSPHKGIDSLRDGFNDDELMVTSPARSPSKRRTSKPNTPTKKRKHPTAGDFDVPKLTLRLSGDRTEPVQAEVPAQTGSIKEVVKDYQSQQHLEVLQQVLAFRPIGCQGTVVDCLMNFAFPSDVSRPLSTILLEEMAKAKGDRFSAELLDVFTTLLVRCRLEGYLRPSQVVLQSIKHVLDLDPLIVDSEVINSLVLPLLELICLNGKVRWALADRNEVWSKENPRPKINEDIDVGACLDILVMMASLVIDEPDLIQLFWKCIDTDFVLLMLAPCQPIPHLTLMLELIGTSVYPDHFGNFCIPEHQAQMETWIVDKICYLLYEPPKHVLKVVQRRQAQVAGQRGRYATNDPTPEPQDPKPVQSEICHFRNRVLDVICKIAMASMPHPHKQNIESHRGTTFLVNHHSVIARLTRLLYDEVNNLYNEQASAHLLHAQLINRSTAILHHLLLSPQARSASFSLIKALSTVVSGVSRFRVALSRIVFREGDEGSIDEGIAEETVEMANDILEEYVTPDEAVQLLAAFGRDVIDVDEDAEMDDPAAAEEAVMAEMEG